MASDEEVEAYSEESAQVWREISRAANAVAVERLKRAHIYLNLQAAMIMFDEYVACAQPTDEQSAKNVCLCDAVEEEMAKFQKSHANLALFHAHLQQLLAAHGGNIPPFNPKGGNATLKKAGERLAATRALLERKDDAQKKRITAAVAKIRIETEGEQFETLLLRLQNEKNQLARVKRQRV